MRLLQFKAAIGLLFALGATADQVLLEGVASASYYYDEKTPKVCSTDLSAQNTGDVTCSNSPLSLNQINLQNLVAINNSLLHDDFALCGLALKVEILGVELDDEFIIADGCAACVDLERLDFSYEKHEIMAKIAGADPCGMVPNVTYRIIKKKLYSFDPYGDSSSGTNDTISSVESAAVASVASMAVPTTISTVATAALATTGATLSTPCSDNAWQCNGNILVQCISSAWTPRVTCAASQTCQGGSNPYCI